MDSKSLKFIQILYLEYVVILFARNLKFSKMIEKIKNFMSNSNTTDLISYSEKMIIQIFGKI